MFDFPDIFGMFLVFYHLSIFVFIHVFIPQCYLMLFYLHILVFFIQWFSFSSSFPFLPLGDLPDPGIKPVSPALASGFSSTEPHGKLHSDTTDMILKILFFKIYFLIYKMRAMTAILYNPDRMNLVK